MKIDRQTDILTDKKWRSRQTALEGTQARPYLTRASDSGKDKIQSSYDLGS